MTFNLEVIYRWDMETIIERNSFFGKPGTIERIAIDLIGQLGQTEAFALADRCARSTGSFEVRAFWLAIAERLMRPV